MFKLNTTLFSALALFTIQSCTVSEAPEFNGINMVTAKTIDLNTIKVEANALFFNPNDIGCEVTYTDINVLVNSIDVGKAVQTRAVSVKGKSNFQIPLVIHFSPTEVFKQNKGIFNGIVSVLTTKKVNIQYKGLVTLNKGLIPFTIDINESQEVPLKLK